MKRFFAGSEACFEHACEIGLASRSSDGESVQQSCNLEQGHQCYEDRKKDHHNYRQRIKKNLPDVVRSDIGNSVDLHHAPDNDFFKNRCGDRRKERTEQNEERSFDIIALEKAQNFRDKTAKPLEKRNKPALSDRSVVRERWDLRKETRILLFFCLYFFI